MSNFFYQFFVFISDQANNFKIVECAWPDAREVFNPPLLYLPHCCFLELSSRLCKFNRYSDYPFLFGGILPPNLFFTHSIFCFSWSVSTFTTMKLPEANTFPAQFLLILSPAPWTLSDPDPTDRSSDQTTLFLDSLELETTGPRVITLKVILHFI